MNDEQLLRYSRQIMLPEIDAQGQLRLANATVLLIGLGGLGSAASIYLSAAALGILYWSISTKWNFPICNAKSPTEPAIWTPEG